MKTMLSMPRTISSAVSVRNAIQIWGSVNHSMRVLSAGWRRQAPAEGPCYTATTGARGRHCVRGPYGCERSNAATQALDIQ